ncbi:MAG: hypothetical protein QM758_25225 [Armatimonas sp.]
MQFGTPPRLLPNRYLSPSGKYTLLVEPTTWGGTGKGRYRLTLDGKTVWQAVRPFTLQKAGVTDSGTVGGYGYSYGLEGMGSDGEGTLDAVIMDSAGRVRLCHKTIRKMSRFPDASPDPRAEGVIVDGEHNRLIIRTADADPNRGQEYWVQFQLSTGKKLDTIIPARFNRRDSPERFILDARPVPDTPFILLHWWRFAEWRVGACFTLVMPDARPVWKWELPNDYEIPGDRNSEDRLQSQIRKSGAITFTKPGGQFAVRIAKEKRQAHFTVSRTSNNGWQIQEVGRNLRPTLLRL